MSCFFLSPIHHRTPLGIRAIRSPSEDLLHVMHQGVASVYIAALICDHIVSRDPSITLKQLDRALSTEIYIHYKRWCKRHGKNVTPCSHIFNAMRFNKENWPDYPELSSTYKASVTKCLMYWCAEFLKEQASGEIPRSHLRAYCAHAFAKFQRVCDQSPQFFSDEETKCCVDAGRTGLLLYQQLATQDRERTDTKRFYKITPKYHSFFEMLLYIEKSRRNPRHLNT